MRQIARVRALLSEREIKCGGDVVVGAGVISKNTRRSGGGGGGRDYYKARAIDIK